MLEFRPFRLGHLEYVVPTAVQADEYHYVMRSGFGELLCNEYALSGWYNHNCIGAAGIVSQGGGRGEAWYLLSPTAKPHMLAVIRQTLRVLDNNHFRRVDMTVKEGNAEGHKIAKLLRFTPESVLEAWHPDGGNMIMYKRIKR